MDFKIRDIVKFVFVTTLTASLTAFGVVCLFDGIGSLLS